MFPPSTSQPFLKTLNIRISTSTDKFVWIRGCLDLAKSFPSFLRNCEYHPHQCIPSFWYLISYSRKYRNSPYSAGGPSFGYRRTWLWWRNQMRFYQYSRLIADSTYQHNVGMITMFPYCICSWFIRSALFQGLTCVMIWIFKEEALILMQL